MSKWGLRDGRSRRLPALGRDVPRGGPPIPRRTKWMPPVVAPDEDAEELIEDDELDSA